LDIQVNGGELSFAQRVFESVEWHEFSVLSGSAEQYAPWLRRFLDAESGEQIQEIWKNIENSVFAQGGIFSATEPTVRVLLASLLDERSEIAVLFTLDLLFHLTQPAAAGSDELARRCLAEIEAGSWLLVGKAIQGSEGVRSACLEILELSSPGLARLVGTAGAQ
jgi:hypothetical protein